MSQEFKSFPGPAAWCSTDFNESEWLYALSPDQQKDLQRVAHSLPDDNGEWVTMVREDAPLSQLGTLLAQVNQELEEGRGFAVLRGLNVAPLDEQMSDVDWSYRLNWVLALNLGEVIAQNAKGEVIGAVQAVVDATDNGLDTRGYVSNAELRFHCDGGDIASLLCVRQAPEGGSNSLVSMVSIHNIMVEECPQHLATLYRGLSMYMRKEEGIESAELPRRPLFYPQDDVLLAWCNLRLMELPYEASGETMPADERAALDAFEEVAERPEHRLSLKLEPGDLLLTHNFVCMHKRSGFTDDPDPAKARLMLRLWYNIPGGRVTAVQPPSQRGGYFTKFPLCIRAD